MSEKRTQLSRLFMRPSARPEFRPYKNEASRKPSALIGVVIGLILTGLLLLESRVAVADHGGTTGGVCMVERFNTANNKNNTSLGCTSNDVSLAEYDKISGPDFCAIGETVSVSIQGRFVSTSAERYDVGVFVTEDGGTPNDLTGTCYSDYLHPVSSDNLDLNLTGGSGPYYNAEITEDPLDSCGDIQQGNDAFFNTGVFDINCQDSDVDETVDVASCTVWGNSASAGTPSKPSCTSEADVTAETTAKCTCSSIDILGILVAQDRGDAPVSYAEADHSINRDLYLGANFPDPNDLLSWGGDGVDNSGTASDDSQEDGTSFNPIGPDVTTSYTLGVTVVNDTGADAELAVWLDLDCSGTFDAGELRTTTVSASGIYGLTWDNGGTPWITAAEAAACPVANTTFARVRLGNDPAFLASPFVAGDGGSGEVEDYAVALDVSTTPAVITQFRAETDAEANNWLRWVTASEQGTSAFRVERWIDSNDNGRGHWSRVHQQAWLPMAHSPQGAHYQLLDNSLLEGESASYRVIERGSRGKPDTHGPYVIESTYSDQVSFSNDSYAFKILLDVQGIEERQATVAANKANAKTKGKKPGTSDTVKLGVSDTGVQFVSAADLADATGLKLRQVRNWLRQGKFELTRNGSEVSWFDTNDGLLFYGEAPDNTWSLESMYWLRSRQPGAVMSEVQLSNGSVDGSRFLSTIRSEQDIVPVLEINHQQTDDYWYWTSIATVVGYDAVTLPAASPGALSEDALLTVALQGYTEVQHEVEVWVGDDLIGTMLFTGQERSNESFAVPANKMGGDTLDVTLRTTGAFGYSSLFIEHLDLAYIRSHTAVAGELAFGQDSSGAVQISNLDQSEGLVVLDISSPLTPRWLDGGKFKFGAFEARFDAGDYFAANASAWKSVSIVPVTDEQKIKNSTQYLVIAPEELMDGARALANYRSGDLNTQLLSLESIYDHTSYGEPDPRSIRHFLMDSINRPGYVVIVGDGAYDYKDQWGTGYNLLSPMLVDGGRFGLVIGDTLVGDMDGDGKIEIPVGRIPAKNNAEILTFIEKLSLNEANGHLPSLLVADDPDQAGNFTHSTNWIASETEGLVSTLLIENIGAGAARTELLAQLDDGLNLINYVGHAGIWTLTDQGLLTNADVPNLENLIAPKLVGLTCNINNFMIPGFDSLGERLLVKTSNGVVACWAAASQSFNAEATALGLAFQQAEQLQERLGDAMLEAFNGATGQEQVYVLLGDPAMKLR